ncbi:MAG: O-antigen ligase family protein [Bacteroidetes bacterium]|nr:O-antigen ligase family protein [Bacteroidota bacterium]
MIRFIKEEFLFLFLVISWTIVGIYFGPAIYIYLPLSIVLLKVQNQIMYLFLGFFLVLIFSDSRHYEMMWAAGVKEVYIVFLGIFLFLDRKSFAVSNTFYQRFLPFLLVAVYCDMDSPDVWLALQKTLSYFLLLAVVPNYVIKLYYEDAQRFFHSLIMLACLVLLVGLVFVFVSYDLVFFAKRYCGLLGNPNGLGIYCMMIFLLLSTIKNLYPDCFTKREYLFIYLVIFFSVFLSGARSSILAMGIFMLFNYFYKMSSFLGFIVFLLIILSYQLFEDNFALIVNALNLEKYIRLETINTASGRIIAWSFAWEEIQKNIFFGRGFSYTDILFHVNEKSLSVKGHQGNAHNSYLTLWLETGLVGLFFYLFALISEFIRSFKKTHVTIPIMYALLFQIFFESWLASSLNPYTINLIMILVIASVATKEFNRGKQELPEEIPDFYPQRFVPR